MLDFSTLPPPEPRRYPAPVSQQRALAILESLRISPDSLLLDASFGTGGLLVDAVALHDCRGLALCSDEPAAERGRALAESERVAARVEWRVETIDAHTPAERYQAIFCVGAGLDSQALVETMPRLHEWLRVGGVLVYGQPFLRRSPTPSYRGLLGAAAERLRAGGVDARSVVNAGFELTNTLVMSETEWDAYESASYRARVRLAEAQVDDAEGRRLRERADAWYHAYWRYGRETLGYAFNLFRKPRAQLRAVS